MIQKTVRSAALDIFLSMGLLPSAVMLAIRVLMEFHIADRKNHDMMLKKKIQNPFVRKKYVNQHRKPNKGICQVRCPISFHDLYPLARPSLSRVRAPAFHSLAHRDSLS